MIKLSIANDYSKFPSGCFHEDGPSNAKDFRYLKLNPALHEAIKNNEKLIISFDGTMGFSSVWLAIAFCDLNLEFNKYILLNIKNGTTEFDIQDIVVLECEDSSIIQEVWEYILQ